MPPRGRFRPALAGDAEALARLRYEFRTALDPATAPERAFLDRCARWMREHLDGGAWCAWIAEDCGEIVGTVWVQFIEKLPNPIGERERHAYVTNLYVRPGHRGSGIGGGLLDLALQECEAREVDAVVLWPTERSRPLYARQGFGAADDLMERRLAPAPDHSVDG